MTGPWVVTDSAGIVAWFECREEAEEQAAVWNFAEPVPVYWAQPAHTATETEQQ